MRPSIAAALSTLGEVHNASEVLLRPADSAKFAEAHLNGEVRADRVIACPSGGLLLVLEAGTCLPSTWTPGLHDRSQFALVGAVEPSAWTWTDPTKRQPAPLARVNLDARDIHCLTQGGEIHRGATVGTTPTGLVALQAARVVNAIAVNLAGSADPEKVIAACRLMLPKPAEAPKPAPSPKVGDRLRDLTPEQRANLPIGTVLAPFPDGHYLIRGADGLWRGWGAPLKTVIGERTIAFLPVSK